MRDARCQRSEAVRRHFTGLGERPGAGLAALEVLPQRRGLPFFPISRIVGHGIFP